MAKTKLIPGFRFHPTDVELAKYFLKRKVLGKKFPVDVIAEVDVYKYAPWDLPDKSFMRTGDLEWFFFCPRGKKYASGARVNRATEVGYWKTTGRDRPIHHKKQIVGMIKTLVFHTGRPPKGDRTDWVMHEFRLEDTDLTNQGIPQDTYVLYRLHKKEGLGPSNGAQYVQAFNEEDYDDDGLEETDCLDSVSLAAVHSPLPILPIANDSFAATHMHPSPNGSIASSSMSCLSEAIPFPNCLMHPSVSSNQLITNDASQVLIDDDMPSMLDCFTEENDVLAPNESNKFEAVDNSGQKMDNEGMPLDDIFKDLGDLNNLAGLGDFSWGQKVGSCAPFLELLDLDLDSLNHV